LENHYRDWNEDFQEAVAMPDGVYAFLLLVTVSSLTPSLRERLSRLAEVARDFQHTATHFAELVVSEMFLPIEKKTVRPVGVGGVAGGTKYSIKGLDYFP